MVYVGALDNNVYGVNASTGAIVWSYTTGSYVESAPAVVNGVVYIGSTDGYVYALNARTGARLWSYLTQSMPDGNPVSLFASPAVVNGVVYIGTANDDVLALNASTGTKLWSYPTGNEVYSSPAVANGVVYVGSDDGNVYALNASIGVKLWSYRTNGPVSTSPAVANGVVYVGSENGNLYALNARTGAKLWSHPTGVSECAVANSVVYIASNDGNLYALNANTGTKLWSYATGVTIVSGPDIVDGVVYLHAADSSGLDVDAFALGDTADLYLRAEPSPIPVVQGDLLTYTFPVWNLGPGAARHEVLTTHVPEGTTFDYVRLSGTPGLGTCTHPEYGKAGPIVCNENSSMAPNTTWTVRLTVKVTAPSGTVIAESATTTEQTPDPNPVNNTATVIVKVR
jgi:outer membrane protein assembly factor BamB